MLQTVDVGTEGGTGAADVFQEGLHLGDGGIGFGLITDTATLDCGTIQAGASGGTGHFLQVGGDVHAQGLGGGATDLELDRTLLEVASGFLQQGLATEGGVVGDVGQLFRQLAELGVQGGVVIGAGSAVGTLGSQILHALNDVGHLVQSAFGGLHHGDGILGVAHADFLAVGLGLQAGSHLQTGRVVGGGVDAKTGTQALHGGAQHLVGVVQLVLGGQGGEVGMDGQAHDVFLELNAAQQPVRLTSDRDDPFRAEM